MPDKFYKRKILPVERLLLRFPNSNIGIMARVNGFIPEKKLKTALEELKKKYVNLNVRIFEDENHDMWFISDETPNFVVKIMPRTTDEGWIQVFLQEHKNSFELDKGPLIRFILLQSKEISELIIICHHAIGHLPSLTNLAENIFESINDTNKKTEKNWNSPLLIRDNFPKNTSGNILSKIMIKIINNKWKKEETLFDKKDVRNLHEAYWKNNKYSIIVKEFSKEETKKITEACHQNNVTVTSALCTAFFLANQKILEKKKQKIDITVDLQPRLTRSVKNTMGYYVGETHVKFKYNIKKSFWDNVNFFHKKIKIKLESEEMFREIIDIGYMHPTLIDATAFMYIGKNVDSSEYGYQKIHDFSNKKSVVHFLLNKVKSNKPDLVISNIGKIKIPDEHHPLKVLRIVPLPSFSDDVNITLGAATFDGKLTLCLNFVEQTIDRATAKNILKEAISFLI